MKKEVWIAVCVGIAVVAIFIFQNGLLSFGAKNQIEELTMTDNNQNSSSQSLEIQDVKVGTGVEAVAGKIISVHYTGTFINGTKFDSSKDRGEPFSFTLGAGDVIAGWDMGILGMKEGGVRKLIIPAELAYGANDYGPIPGNSTLYFEVELLEVK